MAFRVGEYVKYVTDGGGDVYKGRILRCFGPEETKTVFGGYLDNCQFLVEEVVRNPRSQFYSYQIGDLLTVHSSRLKKDLDETIRSKGRNQAVRNVYEQHTGQNATPGTGPANYIREFAGIRIPKHARKTRRNKRKMRR